MKIRLGLLIVVFVIALASCSGTGSSQTGKFVSDTDFGTSWNNHCIDNNFDLNWNVTSTTTLGEMYFGSDFPKDIDLMDIAISRDLAAVSGLAGAGEIELYGFFDPFGDTGDEN